MKMKEENRNLLLAITLSVVVLLGWQFFFAVPQMEKQKQVAQQNQQTQSQQPPAPGSVPTPAKRPIFSIISSGKLQFFLFYHFCFILAFQPKMYDICSPMKIL